MINRGKVPEPKRKVGFFCRHGMHRWRPIQGEMIMSGYPGAYVAEFPIIAYRCKSCGFIVKP